MKKRYIIIAVVILICAAVSMYGGKIREAEENSPIDTEGIMKYLESCDITVYNADDFKAATGMSVFDIQPEKTLLAYIHMPISDVLEWYDGEMGYACIGDMNINEDDNNTLLPQFIKICREYPFCVIISSIDDSIIGYSKWPSNVSKYQRKTGITIDKTYTDLNDFMSALH